MDEVSSFFNLSKEPTPRKRIIGSQTSSSVKVDDDTLNEMSTERTAFTGGPSSYSGHDYVEHYQQVELSNTLRQLSMPVEDERSMEMLDDLTSVGDINRVSELVDDAQYYKKYSIQAKQIKLTINSMKTKILETVGVYPVTVIEGPTGCGKTTQVPQWLLEDHYHRRQFCNIVVTQPRRIAAISIARRVCEENNLAMGSIIGYQVGLDSKVSKDTRLQYVTTGVLLQKLINSKSMQSFTHVILDEVHERNQDMDFLLIVIKKLLLTNRSVKVILMSATFNVEQFSRYFTLPTPGGLDSHPVLKVDSGRMFPLQIFYLQMLSILGTLPEITYESPGISEDMFIFTAKLLNAFEYIDSKEEAESAINGGSFPSVLIFLPGLYEIEELYRVLRNRDKLRLKKDEDMIKSQWLLLPLHSTITTEEQVQVFRPAPPGYRKIILSTNIAESSITVPDIKYVIDFCLTKMLTCDPVSNFSSLQTEWASQANCQQRAGRAGRVREGRVYRMVHHKFYDTLPEECVPEILRCPMDNLVLSSKLLNMGSPVSILALALDPPDLSNINRTVLNLKLMGAMLKTESGELSMEDGDITFMGRIMAKLPLDTRFSKLIVLGYIFGCLDDCVIMAAAMSVKSVFSTPFQDRINSYNSKLTWSDGSSSDCLAYLNVYKVFAHLLESNAFSSMGGGERQWARAAYLQLNSLHELHAMVRELRTRLQAEGIAREPGTAPLWSSVQLPLITKLLLAGAFYPYYFTFSRHGEVEEREATKTLGGRDPLNTVYLNGMDTRQPGIIYSQRVKELFATCTTDEILVAFDSNSSKIYVTFRNRETYENYTNSKRRAVPGKVPLPLYKALKIRQLKYPTVLSVMPHDKSLEYARSLGLAGEGGAEGGEGAVHRLLQAPIPDVDENYIHILMSHVVDCGHFWCQHAEERTQGQLRWLFRRLNGQEPGATPLAPLTGPPRAGGLVAAPFQESPAAQLHYFRARIENILPNNMIWVFYIDYGNNGVVPLHSLRTLDITSEPMRNIQALAFECVLTGVAPSLVRDQRAVWTDSAVQRFQQLTRGMKLLGKVYSVAMGVVSLELFSGDTNINQTLLSEGYAEAAEESYISRLNRDLRDTSKNLQPRQKNALNQQQRKELRSTLSLAVEPPDISQCPRTINLKGPFSPLETNLHNLMYVGKDKSVSVEWSSVNSVLLNTDPQSPNERMLVAARIDQSMTGEHLTLRHTTLLPNIPGLPALVALLFAPTAELKPDIGLRHYSVALCGLGHFQGQPLFPEQDILVPIDVDLTNDDLMIINQLRHHMDLILLTDPGQDTPMSSEQVKATTTQNIKSLIHKLISKPRRYHEAGSVQHGWRWAAPYPCREAEAPNYHRERAIFPPHNGLILQKADAAELERLARANKQIHDICKSVNLSGANWEDRVCPLCETESLSYPGMRLHLNSLVHKQREQDLPPLE